MKKIIFTLTLIILVLFVGVTVFADDPTVQSVLKTDATTVKEGEDLVVTMSVSDITFTQGLAAVTATLNYDDAVFEAVEGSSFTELNNWKVSYSPLAKEIVLSRVEDQPLQKENGDLFSVKLKAKADTAGQKPVIKVTDVKFKDNIVQEYSVAEVATSEITIEKIGSILPTEPETPTPIPTEPETPISTDKEKPEEIPETGLSDTMVYIIAALGIVAVVFYINYKRLERKNIRYINVE